jgi:putative acetyltransferase
MLSIRPARAEDQARALEIWRAAVAATHDFLAPADRVAIGAQVQEMLPAAPLWLAVDETDRPLGFSWLGEGALEALFVDPACHGQGVGRALVEHALGLYPVLRVEVNEQNPRAVAFYERMGFERFGRSKRDGQGRPYPLLQMRRAEA